MHVLIPLWSIGGSDALIQYKFSIQNNYMVDWVMAVIRNQNELSWKSDIVMAFGHKGDTLNYIKDCLDNRTHLVLLRTYAANSHTHYSCGGLLRD